MADECAWDALIARYMYIHATKVQVVLISGMRKRTRLRLMKAMMDGASAQTLLQSTEWRTSTCSSPKGWWGPVKLQLQFYTENDIDESNDSGVCNNDARTRYHD